MIRFLLEPLKCQDVKLESKWVTDEMKWRSPEIALTTPFSRFILLITRCSSSYRKVVVIIEGHGVSLFISNERKGSMTDIDLLLCSLQFIQKSFGSFPYQSHHHPPSFSWLSVTDSLSKQNSKLGSIMIISSLPKILVWQNKFQGTLGSKGKLFFSKFCMSRPCILRSLF